MFVLVLTVVCVAMVALVAFRSRQEQHASGQDPGKPAPTEIPAPDSLARKPSAQLAKRRKRANH
jgi:hypothetical protein